jgi:charged multivesicular body protein 3
VQLLAKEVVRLRGAVARLAGNKANLTALSNEMTQMLAVSNAATTIKSSTQLMTTMNNLVKIPQLQQDMKAMAKEMARAGFIQEMVSDSMDTAMDTESIEDAAAEAVDQVLLEITGETMSQLSAVPTGKVGGKTTVAVETTQVEEDEDDLMQRLAGLKQLA